MPEPNYLGLSHQVDDDILSIDWRNENNKNNPVFRLEHCVFEGIDDIEDGIDGLGTFIFKV